jgi:metal-responsive CopG/Arc/MetJ family transcriptional regulator
MDAEKRYINIYFDKETLERIDQFRYDQRFPSRTEAIRHLILQSLPAVKKPISKPR